MAQAQFKYLIDSVQRCLVDYIEWQEIEIVRLGEEVWEAGLRLRPQDIEDYPIKYEAKMDPALPQNLIFNAQLYMDAHRNGFGTEDWVYEKGFQEEQPENLIRGRILERAQKALTEVMIEDAMPTYRHPAADPACRRGRGRRQRPRRRQRKPTELAQSTWPGWSATGLERRASKRLVAAAR